MSASAEQKHMMKYVVGQRIEARAFAIVRGFNVSFVVSSDTGGTLWSILSSFGRHRERRLEGENGRAGLEGDERKFRRVVKVVKVRETGRVCSQGLTSKEFKTPSRQLFKIQN